MTASWERSRESVSFPGKANTCRDKEVGGASEDSEDHRQNRGPRVQTQSRHRTIEPVSCSGLEVQDFTEQDSVSEDEAANPKESVDVVTAAS